MWSLINKNKRKTNILVFMMLCLMLLAGAILGIYVCDAPDTPTSTYLSYAACGTAISFFLWLITLIYTFIDGSRRILSMTDAQEIPEDANTILHNVVEETAIAAGLPKKPKVYVIDWEMPNAYATGLSPDNSAIAVTKGLLMALNRDELQGVIAHEMAHIVNRDTTYMLFASVMVCTVISIANRMGYGSFRGRSSSRCSGSSTAIGLIIFFQIVIPILMYILYFSLSKNREYLADACAVKFTRYPQGLASALVKITATPWINRNVDSLTSAMFIVHPCEAEELYKQRYSVFKDLFSTHPATEKRIEILSKMAGADFNAYNEAFKKINNRTIIKKSDLKHEKKIDILKPEELVNGGMGLVATSAVVNNISKNSESQVVQQTVEKTEEEIKNTRRIAGDVVWKANKYIFHSCECGTKLKFPPEYAGTTIKCPHCKKEIKIEKKKRRVVKKAS